MSCNSCSSSNSAPAGCKNNGTCGTDGCNKLTVFDWLENMEPIGEEVTSDIFEVRFKNGRKQYYKNTKELGITIGDLVAVEAERGYDVGYITLKGGLIPIQLKRKKINPNTTEFFSILRCVSEKDIEKWENSRNKEENIKKKSRELAISLNLKMKISDVEYQGDGSKATFYYTAAGRVDFRQLIRDMAREFNTRIEMKQIGLREEASRLGGIGSCGRELCCSTWLTDFRSVSTSAARYQQLSLNPQKLAGQCGKLKCCLNYELDSYRNALKAFPKTETKLQTSKGVGVCQKIDIFKGYMWYAYKGDWINWHLLTTDQVKKIIELNKAKKTVLSLEDFSQEINVEAPNKVFENVVGQESLNRFDRPKQRKNKNKSRSRKKNNLKKNA